MSILPTSQRQTQRPLPQYSELILYALWPGIQIDLGAPNGQYVEFCAETLDALKKLEPRKQPPHHEPYVGLELIQKIVPSPETTYNELEEKVRHVYGTGPPPESQDVQKAIRFLVRCWTMTTVDLRARRNGFAMSWKGTQTLASIIEGQLSPLETASEACVARVLDTDLKATNLIKYQRIQIKWDSDLSRHLKLTRTGGKLTLYVFKHKAWLKNNLFHSKQCPLPKDVLEEAIRTLNILFPPGDDGTKKLLADRKEMHAIGNCRVETTRDLGAFRYWRARMAELEDLMNGPQKGIRQMYRLDKNRDNLMNVVLFWVSGVAVLMLTVVGSVCGIMSLRVSQDAYELSRAAACADPDIRAGLPQYCLR